MSALADRVSSFLGRWNLAGTSGIVAVSGGPDSVALACLAVQLRDLGHLATIHLAHLNHQLRGCESDGDEDFVANLGERLKTPVIRARRDVGQRAREAGANLEDTARRTRYAWLDEVARQQNAAWIATGHTADDQAETVLLGLGRGSGARSVAGMRVCDPPWFRPLLAVRRRDTVAACAELDLSPWNDPHNADPRFTRARLRRDVLPLLEEVLGGGVSEALARTAAALREDTDLLDQMAADHLATAQGADGLRVQAVRELPEALRRRVLRAWLLAGGASGLTDIQIRGVDTLVTGWRGQGGVAVGCSVPRTRMFAERRGDTLRLRTESV